MLLFATEQLIAVDFSSDKSYVDNFIYDYEQL